MRFSRPVPPLCPASNRPLLKMLSRISRPLVSSFLRLLLFMPRRTSICTPHFIAALLFVSHYTSPYFLKPSHPTNCPRVLVVPVCWLFCSLFTCAAGCSPTLNAVSFCHLVPCNRRVFIFHFFTFWSLMVREIRSTTTITTKLTLRLPFYSLFLRSVGPSLVLVASVGFFLIPSVL